MPGTPSMLVSPSYPTLLDGVCIRARTRAPVLTDLIFTSVTPSDIGINPISRAAEPTPDKILPQVGLKSTSWLSTLT